MYLFEYRGENLDTNFNVFYLSPTHSSISTDVFHCTVESEWLLLPIWLFEQHSNKESTPYTNERKSVICYFYLYLYRQLRKTKIYTYIKRSWGRGLFFLFLFSYLTTTTDDECQHIFKFIAMRISFFPYFSFCCVFTSKHQTATTHHRLILKYYHPISFQPSVFQAGLILCDIIQIRK